MGCAGFLFVTPVLIECKGKPELIKLFFYTVWVFCSCHQGLFYRLFSEVFLRFLFLSVLSLHQKNAGCCVA